MGTDAPGLTQVGGLWCPAGDPYFTPQLEDADLVDQPSFDLALSQVSRFSAALDVGAHIGTWTRRLAARFARVTALEPDPLNYEALIRNVAGMSWVRALRLAAASGHGRLSLDHAGKINSGEGYLVPHRQDLPEVKVIAVDALGLSDLGLVKIDVEGTEHEVLGGAEATIRGQRPVVVIEESAAASRYGRKVADARQRLEGWGMIEMARIEYPRVWDVVMSWPHADHGEPR